MQRLAAESARAARRAARVGRRRPRPRCAPPPSGSASKAKLALQGDRATLTLHRRQRRRRCAPGWPRPAARARARPVEAQLHARRRSGYSGTVVRQPSEARRDGRRKPAARERRGAALRRAVAAHRLGRVDLRRAGLGASRAARRRAGPVGGVLVGAAGRRWSPSRRPLAGQRGGVGHRRARCCWPTPAAPSGRAAPCAVLTGGPGSRDASALPGRLDWTLRPRRGLALELRAAPGLLPERHGRRCSCSPGFGRIAVDARAARPAGSASGRAPGWPAWARRGTRCSSAARCGSRRPGLTLESVQGRWRVDGAGRHSSCCGVSSRLSHARARWAATA